MKVKSLVAAMTAACLAWASGACAAPTHVRSLTVSGGVTSVNAASTSFVLKPVRGGAVTVDTSPSTDFRKNDGTAAAFADVEAGGLVTATGTVNTDGSLQARRVLLTVVQHVTVDGAIASVNSAANSFVVQRHNNLTVTVDYDANTDFRNNDGTAATAADLAAGKEVLVSGIQNADDSIAAKRVLFIVVRRVEVDGTITSVGAGSVTVQRPGGLSVVVNTDVNTDIRRNDGTAGSFADLTTGRQVEVRGVQNADGTVQAQFILVLVVQNVNVYGVVTSVDAGTTSFVVRRSGGLSTTVHTSASTDFRKNDGTTAAFSDVAVGLTVSARGPQSSDGSLNANQVTLIVARHVEADGTVSGVDSPNSRFTLDEPTGVSLTVTVTASTVFRKNNGLAATLADVTPGVDVIATGAPNTDGSLAADHVTIVVRHSIVVEGPISSVTAGTSSFLMQPHHGPNLTVHTDAGTDFRKNDGTGASFADLAAGLDVQVTGTQNPDGSLQATRVLLLVVRTVDIQGVVVTVDAASSSFVLQGPGRLRKTIDVTPDTDLRKNDGTVAAFSDLAAGQKVEVNGVASSTGAVVTAGRVTIQVVRTVLVQGLVSSVTSTSFMMHPVHGPDVQVNVTAGTTFALRTGGAASFADVVAGKTVLVLGTQAADGTLTASVVTILR